MNATHCIECGGASDASHNCGSQDEAHSYLEFEMGDFSVESYVKSTRKERRCGSCRYSIPIGSPALRISGVWEGEFYSQVIHPICRQAEIALNKLHGCYGDEWISLRDMESDDLPWLLAEFPEIAARMGITAESVAHTAAEMEARRIAFTRATPSPLASIHPDTQSQPHACEAARRATENL